jgi:xanthine dehydrogenase molybdopterin-binding subunit B
MRRDPVTPGDRQWVESIVTRAPTHRARCRRGCTLSTYKVPDLPSTPVLEGHPLPDADNPKSMMRSNAIGEPPFMYGIGGSFAIRHAL